MAEEVLILITSWPDAESARRAARTLIEEKLAACANIIPNVGSIYTWQGRIEEAAEVMAIFKTTRDRYQMAEDRIRALHTYDVPEIIAFPPTVGAFDYLRWVEQSCCG